MAINQILPEAICSFSGHPSRYASGYEHRQTALNTGQTGAFFDSDPGVGPLHCVLFWRICYIGTIGTGMDLLRL